MIYNYLHYCILLRNFCLNFMNKQKKSNRNIRMWYSCASVLAIEAHEGLDAWSGLSLVPGGGVSKTLMSS